jgi:hypothetical protein
VCDDDNPDETGVEKPIALLSCSNVNGGKIIKRQELERMTFYSLHSHYRPGD